MLASPKQERGSIRNFNDLLRRFDLEAIAYLKQAQKSNAEGLNKINAEMLAFVAAVQKSIIDMQDQIDGNITTHFYNGKPTLTNMPASEWNTEVLKNNHLGDLYYDRDTGYAYRFAMDGTTYKWEPLKDNDIAKALALANTAQDTADSKRRVFMETPAPPYDKGDWWIKDKELYVCNTARSEGAFNSGDFGIATKYTDDTKANEVANNLAKNYTTTVDMNSAIETSAAGVLTTVSKTYTTKSDMTNEITVVKNQISEVDLKADGISTRVTDTENNITGLSGRVTNTESSYTQLSNKFSWIVASGTSKSNFTLTPEMATLVTNAMVIKDSTGSATIIQGGKIDLEELFAQDITASGTITGAKLVGTTFEGGTITLESDGDTVANCKFVSLNGCSCSVSPARIAFYNPEGSMEAYLWGSMGILALNLYEDDGVTLKSNTVISALGISTASVSALQSLSVATNMHYADYPLYVEGNAKISNELLAGKVSTTSGADLDQLNSDLKNLVKRMTFTATTDAWGQINISLYINDVDHVLSMMAHDTTLTICQYYYVVRVFQGTGLDVYANKSVTMTVNYI